MSPKFLFSITALVFGSFSQLSHAEDCSALIGNYQVGGTYDRNSIGLASFTSTNTFAKNNKNQITEAIKQRIAILDSKPTSPLDNPAFPWTSCERVGETFSLRVVIASTGKEYAGLDLRLQGNDLVGTWYIDPGAPGNQSGKIKYTWLSAQQNLPNSDSKIVQADSPTSGNSSSTSNTSSPAANQGASVDPETTGTSRSFSFKAKK